MSIQLHNKKIGDCSGEDNQYDKIMLQLKYLGFFFNLVYSVCLIYTQNS